MAVFVCLALLGAALWGAGAARADKLITVNSTADSGAGLGCVGGETCTLRRAVEEITEGKYSGAVTVEFSVHGRIEIGAFGPLELEVPEKVTSVQIAGPGSGEAVTVSGEEATRIFEIEGGEVTLERLTLAEGKRDGTTIGASGGGAIYQGGGTLLLRDMLLRDNSVESSRSGGAIYQDEGNLRIVDSTIEGSSTDSDVFAGSAGAIFVDTSNSSWLELDGTRITGSTAEGRGGAIFQNSGSMIIKDSELDHNTATNSGGALYADADGSEAKTTITESRLLANTSGSEGGAIYSDNGDAGLALVSSTVAGNKADGGAGIVVQGPTTVLRSTINANEAAATAGFHGGGIAVNSSTVEVVASTIANNVGEGIYFQFSGSSVVGSTIASNKSNGEAGGIAGPEIISVTSSILAYNEGSSGPADCA
ncbi:MAG TPA: right-handed parallel beta-helix repeat-containing protein, partial [Solirubrobacterales bacterium]|nr:right-handed parallel beta-helix repeat-containing protein [Solirubrobacterales bacterium]